MFNKHMNEKIAIQKQNDQKKKKKSFCKKYVENKLKAKNKHIQKPKTSLPSIRCGEH